MKYLIDTNICIYIMNQRPKKVFEKVKELEPGDIGVSVITLSELRYGALKSSFQEKNHKRLDEFLAPFDILEYDEADTKIYGDVRSSLEKAGKPIGPLDLLIGAHALSRDLALVTNNEKEFLRIDCLQVENWAE